MAEIHTAPLILVHTITLTPKHMPSCPDGGIGRRAGLKNQWALPMPVRSRLRVPPDKFISCIRDAGDFFSPGRLVGFETKCFVLRFIYLHTYLI